MAQTFVQAADPIWYTANLAGAPNGGGSLDSFNSLDPTMRLPIYQNAMGTLAFPNPILLDMNGTISQPLYFLEDSAIPLQSYNLVMRDNQGNKVWQINDFLPNGGGGGGTTIQTNLSGNLIVNNVFYRGNTGPNAIVSTSPLPLLSIVAPGVHSGLANTFTSGGTSIHTFGPDIQFIKDNTSATDTLTLVPFVPGANPLSTIPNVITPYNYLNYTCTSPGTGEVTKVLQIPITSKVQSLANLISSQTVYARSNSGTPQIQMQFVQFFGDGTNSPSATFTQAIGPAITLSSGWIQYGSQTSIPNVLGVNLGNCGNDGLFLQIKYPVDQTCNIDIAIPSVYLGIVNADFDYVPYDTIEASVNTNRTGDIRVSLNTFQPFGWVAMNDGTIALSNVNSTPNVTRANQDTFPLFNMLWNAFFANQSLAQMFTNAASPTMTAYGASAIADFGAGNQISLTKQAGRLIAGVGLPSSGNNTGTSWTEGMTTGNELITLDNTNLPDHLHSSPPVSGTAGGMFLLINGAGGGGAAPVGMGFTSSGATGTNPRTGGVSVQAFNAQNPVSYQNIYMKL